MEHYVRCVLAKLYINLLLNIYIRKLTLLSIYVKTYIASLCENYNIMEPVMGPVNEMIYSTF